MSVYESKSDGLELLLTNYQDPVEFAKFKKEQEQKELERRLYELQCSAPVEDIDDLIWKYEEYDIAVDNNILYSSMPINMRRFMTMKKDAAKCGVENIVVKVLKKK